MLKPELAKQQIRGWSATFGGTAMRLLQDLKGGDKETSRSLCQAEKCERGNFPCSGMTHAKGEIGNLIFRGEDLLLGDHGQPYQTLGKGNKRDARTIT